MCVVCVGGEGVGACVRARAYIYIYLSFYDKFLIFYCFWQNDNETSNLEKIVKIAKKFQDLW